MKTLLYLTGILLVLTTSGCLVSEQEWHGRPRAHERYERRAEVIVAPPAVVVRAPIIVVRPPEVIIR